MEGVCTVNKVNLYINKLLSCYRTLLYFKLFLHFENLTVQILLLSINSSERCFVSPYFHYPSGSSSFLNVLIFENLFWILDNNCAFQTASYWANDRKQKTGENSSFDTQQTSANILRWWSTPGLQGSKPDVGAGRI